MTVRAFWPEGNVRALMVYEPGCTTLARSIRAQLCMLKSRGFALADMGDGLQAAMQRVLEADMVILLMTPDLLEEEYVPLLRACRSRYEAGTLKVQPVMARTFDKLMLAADATSWLLTPKWFPDPYDNLGSKGVLSMSNMDEALSMFAGKVRAVFTDILAQKRAARPTTPEREAAKKALGDMSVAEFDGALFALHVPIDRVPGMGTPMDERIAAALDWLDGEGRVREVLKLGRMRL